MDWESVDCVVKQLTYNKYPFNQKYKYFALVEVQSQGPSPAVDGQQPKDRDLDRLF